MLWFDERTHFYALHNNNVEWRELLERQTFPASTFQMHSQDNLVVMSYYSHIIGTTCMFIHWGLKLVSIFRGYVLEAVISRDLNMFMPYGGFTIRYRGFSNPLWKTVASFLHRALPIRLSTSLLVYTFLFIWLWAFASKIYQLSTQQCIRLPCYRDSITEDPPPPLRKVLYKDWKWGGKITFSPFNKSIVDSPRTFINPIFVALIKVFQYLQGLAYMLFKIHAGVVIHVRDYWILLCLQGFTLGL